MKFIREYFCLVGFIAIGGCWLLSSHLYGKAMMQESTKSANKINKMEIERSKIKSNIHKCHIEELFVTSLLDSGSIMDLDKDKIILKSLLKGERHLVLFFHKTVCPVCIELEIERLKKLIDPDRLIFMTTDENIRFMKVLNVQYKLKYKTMFWKSNRVDSSMLTGNLPLYFISDGKNHSLFFISDKALPDMTDNYLLKIKQLLEMKERR